MMSLWQANNILIDWKFVEIVVKAYKIEVSALLSTIRVANKALDAVNCRNKDCARQLEFEERIKEMGARMVVLWRVSDVDIRSS